MINGNDMKTFKLVTSLVRILHAGLQIIQDVYVLASTTDIKIVIKFKLKVVDSFSHNEALVQI